MIRTKDFPPARVPHRDCDLRLLHSVMAVEPDPPLERADGIIVPEAWTTECDIIKINKGEEHAAAAAKFGVKDIVTLRESRSDEQQCGTVRIGNAEYRPGDRVAFGMTAGEGRTFCYDDGMLLTMRSNDVMLRVHSPVAKTELPSLADVTLARPDLVLAISYTPRGTTIGGFSVTHDERLPKIYHHVVRAGAKASPALQPGVLFQAPRFSYISIPLLEGTFAVFGERAIIGTISDESDGVEIHPGNAPRPYPEHEKLIAFFGRRE